MTSPPAFFEGPEKKVELAVTSEHRPLRELGEVFWREVVAAANAEILATLENEHAVAYLLSESSLFVYDEFVTMITCGRTTMVDAILLMLREIDRGALEYLIYERKNEHFPSDQVTGFYEDARRLREMLPGRALRFGVEHEHAIRVFHTDRPFDPDPEDRTIEILMHDIDREVAAEFIGGRPIAADRLRMPRVLDGFELDDFAFEPVGYSFNGLRERAYVTLHVTPERFGSYVSFETNAGFEPPASIVSEVVGRFRPDSFDVMIFDPSPGPMELAVPGYVQRRHVHEPVCGYGVTFLHFYRPSSAPTRALVVPL